MSEECVRTLCFKGMTWYALSTIHLNTFWMATNFEVGGKMWIGKEKHTFLVGYELHISLTMVLLVMLIRGSPKAWLFLSVSGKICTLVNVAWLSLA